MYNMSNISYKYNSYNKYNILLIKNILKNIY